MITGENWKFIVAWGWSRSFEEVGDFELVHLYKSLHLIITHKLLFLFIYLINILSLITTNSKNIIIFKTIHMTFTLTYQTQCFLISSSSISCMFSWVSSLLALDWILVCKGGSDGVSVIGFGLICCCILIFFLFKRNSIVSVDWSLYFFNGTSSSILFWMDLWMPSGLIV